MQEEHNLANWRYLQSSNPSSFDCSGSQYTEWMVLQFGIKPLPALIFLVTGFLRYLSIKDTAKCSVRYSWFFKTKVILSSIIAAGCFVYIFFVYIQSSDAKDTSHINACNKDNFSLFFLIQGIAWSFSVFLLIFEYQRLLSEARYSH